MARFEINRARLISHVACAVFALGISSTLKADLIGLSADADGGLFISGLGETTPGSNIGAAQITWGIDTCSFDGTNTSCAVSGSYTEAAESTRSPGATGTFIFTQNWPGNGASPLIGESIEPFSDQILPNMFGDSFFSLDLTGNDGFALSLGGGFAFGGNGDLTTLVCTGLPGGTPCAAGQVALVQGATAQSEIGTFQFAIPDELFVPLPATLWLFLTGGLAMGGAARRWSRRSNQRLS